MLRLEWYTIYLHNLSALIALAIAAHVGIAVCRLILPERAAELRIVAGSVRITATVGGAEAVPFDTVALAVLLAVGKAILMRGLNERRLGIGCGRRWRRCDVIRLMTGASGEQSEG